MKVTFVGSHLFEPTHYSLIGLLYQIQTQIEVSILAKHPMAHLESGTDAPCALILPEKGGWSPDTDIVHAIGGGETAIKIAMILDSKIPMIVTFVGGADLSRQLKLDRLRGGYKRLFERVQLITCPDHFGLLQLKNFGAPSSKIVLIPAALPLCSYDMPQYKNDCIAIMVGRAIQRKNHARALEIATFSKKLQKLIIVGRTDLKIESNKQISQFDNIPHSELIKFLSKSNVLLQTGDWKGEEIDSLPTIVLEALAMGIPVLSTPLFGVKELSRKFPDFLQIAKTVPELAEKLDYLLVNNIKRERLKVRQWILQHHSLEKISQKILNIYQEIAK